MRLPLIWPPFWPSIRPLALIGVLLLGSMPARAQDTREGIALRNQLYELQQQVQALQQQVASQGGGGSYLGRSGGYNAPPSSGGNDMVAQLLARTQNLEEEVRQLRGRVDELQNAQERQAADLGKRIDDLAFQVNPQAMAGQQGGTPGMAPGMAPAPGGMSSPPPTPLGTMPANPNAPGFAQAPQQPAAPPAPPVKRTPEVAMQEGNAALARRDYPAAESAARDVLSNYRTSPRAYDAQFLLAQSLAGERQYSQAAIAYDDTYNRNRKGAYAPPALVGLANSLTAINEKHAACETLTKLHREFPQLRTDVRDNAAAVQTRAGCK